MLYRILFFLNVIIISFFNIEFLAGQTEETPDVNYSRSKEYIIGGIDVQGIKNYDENILIQMSGLKIGQTIKIPGDQVTNVIKKFWRHGLFSDVELRITRVEDKTAYLTIYLQERPRISKMEFKGLNKSEIDDISEKIEMVKGSQVTPNLVINAERVIRDHFVEKGFFDTEVEIVEVDDTTSSNTVVLKINVDKKEKTKIKEFIIEGNEVFTDNRVNRIMKNTNQRRKLRNFFRSKKFIKDKFEEDQETLINKYNQNGYRDAYIEKDSIWKSGENTVNVKLVVDEGPQFYFGDIKWVGNTIHTSEELNFYLKIKKGDIYNTKRLNKRLREDEDAVSNIYLDDGYLFFQVDPVEVNVYNDTIDLEMRIYEGQQARINNVIIRGNTKTHEHVVRRELRVKPGQLFNKTRLVRDVRELAQLGHFDPETINPIPLPDPETGTVDIEYNLEEKANDQIELSGGWGAGMVIGTIGLRFSNFSVRNIFNGEAWKPLPTGDGQTLSLRAQTNGRYYSSYSMSFVEPWLGGKRPNQFTFSMYHSRQSGINSSYYNNYYLNSIYGTGPRASDFNQDEQFSVTGISVGLGKRLSWPDDFFQLYTAVNYDRYYLKNWAFISRQFDNGTSKNLSFTSVLSRNSTDNPLYSRSGSKFSLSLQFTPPYSLFNDKDYSAVSDEERYEWIEFHKWKFSGQVFKPLDRKNKLVVMARAEYGFLGYYDENRRSPFEGFDVGGDGMTGYSLYGRETVALRGYENNSLSPLGSSNFYNKYTLELRYPLSLKPSATIYALGFLEAGNAWYEFEDFNPFTVNRAAGVGIRIFLPMFGLMGIDWGYGFDELPDQPGAHKSQFHFVIGQQF